MDKRLQFISAMLTVVLSMVVSVSAQNANQNQNSIWQAVALERISERGTRWRMF